MQDTRTRQAFGLPSRWRNLINLLQSSFPFDMVNDLNRGYVVSPARIKNYLQKFSRAD